MTLSYVIATRNRLPFLRITLQHLLAGLQRGEEVVVVDGDSTDGSKEYLQQLFDDGKIHRFVSEPDRNQAHAWNKAMLMAKGQIIKKVMDDDVFDYTSIRACRSFMIANPQVDVCISNSLNADVTNPGNSWPESRLAWFENWKSGKTKSFTFGDVHMLIRKSALTYVGLYDTQFVMMDWEYSLRISYLKCKIAFYTGYNAMSVSQPENVTSNTLKDVLKLEGLIGKTKYQYKGDGAEISLYSKFKIKTGTLISSAKKSEPREIPPAKKDLENIYRDYYQTLRQYNEKIEAEFII